MPDVRTPCPSAQQLSDFGLGKLSPGDVSAIHEHLTNCPQCRQKVAEQPPDSFVGQLRAAAPQASNTVLPRRTAGTPTTLDDVPPELAASSKFEMLGKIGEGGMGAVWKAQHTFLGEMVAIKVMNAAALANPEARSRFLREMKAVGQLHHKNIVRALDAEQMGDLLVLVMEYVEGITLDRLVAQKGILPVAYSCSCIARAALGLQYAHEKKMVHRDIKPANLIVAAKEKEIKLLDFGLARGPRELMTGSNQTQSGVVMGTPAFMAPEQATDASSADIRADIYSLGCTLYFLLAGQSPFQRDSALGTMMAQVGDQARPLPEVRPEVSAELWAVMAKMLAKKPAERYQTPKEVEQALRPFAAAGAKVVQPSSRQQAGQVDAATLLPGDTRSMNPPPPSPVAAPAEKASPFALPASAPAVKNKRETKGKKAPRTWRPLWIAGIAAGVLAVVLFGAIVLTLRTPGGGKVFVEINQADAEVFVDGKKIEIRVPGDKDPIEITVHDDKEHTLKVKKGGFETDTRTFTYRTAKGNPIRVTLKPAENAKEKVGETKPVEGFVWLFNGKDKKGWKPHPAGGARWEVRDGVLIGSGDMGYLFTEKSYQNFHLRAEARVNDESKSAIFFRTLFDPASPVRLGCAAQINSTHTDTPKTGSLSIPGGAVVPIVKSPAAADEWFTLEIIADGQHLVVKVNGEITANYIDAAPNARVGHFALKVHDAATTVEFRKIEVKELPSGDRRLQWVCGLGVFEQVKGNVWIVRWGDTWRYYREVARTADRVELYDSSPQLLPITNRIHLYRDKAWSQHNNGRWFEFAAGRWVLLPRTVTRPRSPAARVGEWVSLFNGKDLTGWQAPAMASGKVTWVFQDGELVARSNGVGPDRLLQSRRADYNNFHLRMETMLREVPNGDGLLIRSGPPEEGGCGNRSYMINIAGNNADPKRTTGTLSLFAHYGVWSPLAHAPLVTLKPGEWFSLEVLAEGNRLRVLVKGTIVVDFTDTNATFTRGQLVLLCPVTGSAKYRKVEIKELTPAQPE